MKPPVYANVNRPARHQGVNDMDMRELKGLEIAAKCKLTYEHGFWQVPSMSGNGTYRVDLKPTGHTCNCDDFELRQRPCKHIHAARIVREREGGEPVKLDTDKVPKRPTYKQDWSVYNLAQSIEKHRFKELLADLCRPVEGPPKKPHSGPKPHPYAEAIFAMVYKVYEGFSSRRMSSDLREVYQQGYTSRPIPGIKVCSFFTNPDLTPILTELVTRSSLPLKTVDTKFAADSSGFSTSRFVKWFDEKYGKERSGHDWVKVHLMVGVKTHIITAIRIEGRHAADSPQFKPLLETTSEHFTVKEACADSAYLSTENVDAVAACGGEAFIAPKVNTTGGVGGLFEKMFHYYQFRRDEFLQHYHQRSNVESAFSMMKRKFGDSVRAKNDVAMVNEALCKALCHNLCVNIMSQCELGIESVFWADEKQMGGDVLPMVRPG